MAGNVDGVIVLEVTQNLRSCSFEDEVMYGRFQILKSLVAAFFYARGRLSK